MRTPLTYYGGKQRIAAQIVAMMPSHRVYLEPFAGGAAVLFAKPRAHRETLNDLDGAVVAFWRIVRDRPDELAAAIELTPYSREEFATCRDGVDGADDDLERARRLLVSIEQSYSRSGASWSPPSLPKGRRGRWQAGTWENIPDRIVAAAERLRGVALENTDAVAMLERWDLDDAVIYADPPYTGDERLDFAKKKMKSRGYREDDHPDLWPGLVDALLELRKAAVILSGYPCAAAERLEEAGWYRIAMPSPRIAGITEGKRVEGAPETIWVNREPHGQLFDHAAVGE